MSTLAVAIAFVLFQEPAPEKLKQFVARLSAEEIEEREAAAKALVEMGEPALPGLRKLAEGDGDEEVRNRIKTVVAQIEKNAARSKVYRPSKPVTLSVTARPLQEAVREACGQAGATCDVAADAADLPVTLEAKDEPILKVLDRLCAASGDATWERVEGKVKVSKGKPSTTPTAYADCFRARVKRVTTFHVNDFAEPRTTVIVYVDFDGEPGVAPRGAVYGGDTKATWAKGEFVLKPVAGRGGGSISSGGKGHLVVDDVPIAFDEQVRAESACYAKGIPAEVKKLDGLVVKAKFRFATGTRVAKCVSPKEMGGSAKFEELPITAQFLGKRILLRGEDRGSPAPLEEIADLDSLVIVKDGKEFKCPSEKRGGRGNGIYLFTCEVDTLDQVGWELRINTFADIFEKEVEFKLGDVAIRE